jgi:tetratricopeptide (TPR) repeat protein
MKLLATVLAAGVLAFLCTAATQAQGSGQDSSSSSKPKPPAGSAPPAAADASDPISRRINNTAPAEHDVEVGQYYMKKEKYDAAIDRFKDATVLLPDYSPPYRLMGEAYEKKKFLPEALQAYQKYLTLKVAEKDADDIRKRVTRLQGEIQEQEKRRQAATKP